MALAGVGLVDSGVFVADGGNRAVSFHGNMHMTFSLVFPLATHRRFCLREALLGRSPIRDLLAGHGALVIPASFMLTFVVPPGLSQRVMLIIVWTWITILGLRLRKAAVTAANSQPGLEPFGTRD